MINVTKLSKELIAAGISVHGNCNSAGVVWDDNNIEIQTRADVLAILAAHDPNLTAAELATIARKANARAEAALAIQLKTLTPTQAVAYIETNVIDLPSAKAVLKIMARMLIAMRDEVWPDLPQ